MKILYIDPIFGISGDMMLSALIDAGVPFASLEGLLQSIPLKMPRINPVRLKQGLIDGIHLDIERSDIHLSVNEMQDIIQNIEAEDIVRKDALGMLSIIVDAESKVHGVSRDKVHFHELSHIDTVIDLTCAAFGIHVLAVGTVFCAPVPCGSGTIKTSHGIIPNPPPVTLEILKDHRMVFYEENLELTTPTGAAIVAYYAQKTNRIPAFATLSTGYGVGTYASSRPDVLRIFVGETGENSYDQEVCIVEADIDDMDMEYAGAVLDRIRDTGARDVLHFPVSMKKGRTGLRLSVTCEQADLEKIVQLIFDETTTFGVRWHTSYRRILRREETTLPTSLGPVRVKKGYDRSGRITKTHIEFDDLKSLADTHNMPYRVALKQIKREINE
jgi:pyridinium-3,5-bisthiocarboxylic acid mononucleotide nickel chelatase